MKKGILSQKEKKYLNIIFNFILLLTLLDILQIY